MKQQVEQLQELEDRLRLGGGSAKIEKQHRDGKLTARERGLTKREAYKQLVSGA